jgi:hypothetical protein
VFLPHIAQVRPVFEQRRAIARFAGEIAQRLRLDFGEDGAHGVDAAGRKRVSRVRI